jgi:hypothetical protein
MVKKTTSTSAPIDPMLAELAGEPAASIVKTDPEIATAAAEKKVDPLELAAPEAAKKTPLKGYAVTISGHYLAPALESPGRKIQKAYTEVFNVKTLEGAQGMIKKYLLDKRLAEKYPDFVSSYTYDIVDTKPLSNDTPESRNIQYMSEKILLAHIADANIPIDVDMYCPKTPAGLMALRRSVIDFTLNPKDFAQREAKRVEEIKIQRDLESLNDVNG